MKLTRHVFIYPIFVLFMIGCTDKDEAIAIPDAYRIPLSVENGRFLLRYITSPMNDTLLVELKRFTKDGVHYEQRTQYLKGQPVSMRLFEIAPGTFKLLREYGYQAGEKVAVAVMDQHNMERDGHKGYEMVSHTTSPDLRTLKRTVREIFDKDTVFRWNGEDIPGLKFRFESDEVVINRFIPFFNEKKEGRGFLIYAKGMGNTYLSVAYGELVLELKLIGMESVTD